MDGAAVLRRLLILLCFCALPARAGFIDERPDLEPLFGGTPGCFALYDVAADRLLLVNPGRANTRYIPASTFKLANSLIALETAAVRDIDEVIPYGGQAQPFKAWEKDMPMREAFPASNVPVYQEIARRVGLPRMQAMLERLDYGNHNAGTVVDRFWLRGPLQISAVEQARFVARLAQGQLPFSAGSQSAVREIAGIETRGGDVLYGKTGWVFGTQPQIGWWVGWVEREGRVYGFALNIDLQGEQDIGKRRQVGEAILRQLQLF
ncbi:class D beta-lactamase [Solimonas sp. SE-A11]|uniref:class D beta-lactamase n=1 Tax=Solimonas sp. SE-A11 TaxID=3054954 RepID=UPI00259C823F|nr:class D beta-lactamase [Solimonas sp. SE-A11]MDM4771854.1 class D beta-lactamase [Solimonas sp. SE-A11]